MSAALLDAEAGATTGGFLWYELWTGDPDAAARFYGAVLDWQVTRQEGAPVDYRMLVAADGDKVGGCLALDAAMRAGGAAPGWLAYLHVADVDAAVAEITGEGGQRLMQQTVPDVGTIALLTDPQGILLYVMTPRPPAGQEGAQSTAFAPDRAGHVAWNELHTPDPAASEAFYVRRFGWARGDSMPMGPMGDYVFLNLGEQPIGALMQVQPGTPPGWQMYWRTGDIDAARARIAEAGGTILQEPHQVPGEEWVLVAADPEGVSFGLVGTRG